MTLPRLNIIILNIILFLRLSTTLVLCDVSPFTLKATKSYCSSTRYGDATSLSNQFNDHNHCVLQLASDQNRIKLNNYQNNIHDTPYILSKIPRGGASGWFAGMNPFGYTITDLGLEFLTKFDGSRDCDVGKFLSTLKSGGRKTKSTIKDQWLEIVRISKEGQSMRIYRTLDDLIAFCLKAGFIN